MDINASDNELRIRLRELYKRLDEKDDLITKLIRQLKEYQLKEQEEKRKERIKEVILSGKR